MLVINTSECEYCKHGVLDDSNRATVKVYCKLKNKNYYYGMIVPCDDKEKKGKETDNNEN